MFVSNTVIGKQIYRGERMPWKVVQIYYQKKEHKTEPCETPYLTGVRKEDMSLRVANYVRAVKKDAIIVKTKLWNLKLLNLWGNIPYDRIEGHNKLGGCGLICSHRHTTRLQYSNAPNHTE